MSTSNSEVLQQPKKKGRFITKRKAEWLENVSTAAKRPRNREPPETTTSIAGRRVVNLKILADQMWCTLCDVPLSLKYIEEEKIYGLASKLKVRCHICLGIHEIDTDSKHKTPDGKLCYSSNSKAALGMIDAGIGFSHDVRVLAQLIATLGVSDEIVRQHAKTVLSITQAGARKSQVVEIIKSLEILRPEVSVGMVKRMAENGITLHLLTKLYTENGLKGVEVLFAEDVQGKPRISKQNKLLSNVGQKLCYTV